MSVYLLNLCQLLHTLTSLVLATIPCSSYFIDENTNNFIDENTKILNDIDTNIVPISGSPELTLIPNLCFPPQSSPISQ